MNRQKSIIKTDAIRAKDTLTVTRHADLDALLETTVLASISVYP